jgi:hypothetical protein
MSTPDSPVLKNHLRGSWNVIRSKAIPSNVTTSHANTASAVASANGRQNRKVEEVVAVKSRKSPGYFETANSTYPKA